MNDTTKNFWEAFAQPVDPTPVIFYRLYHNEQGFPLFYSMEDLPGNYIDIDAETFAQSSPHVRVVNGKLISTQILEVTKKLIPGNTGTTCHPQDICVIVEQEQTNIKWERKTYESH